MALLELRGVQKTYGRFKAVDGLDMSVEPGSIFGFLGRNGAGKTTSIRMMVGLARTTAGEILVCGERVRFGSPVRHIGYLPDVPAFYGTMRPLAYLTLCGQLSGMRTKTAANRAQEMLAQVGLGDVRRRIAGFSRGMKQRLGIAQAMLHHPQLLILDEPTSALDPVGREDVLQLIMALKGQVAVLFSTHVLADVQRVCDTVGILQGGRMALTGGLAELEKQYAGHSFTLATAMPEKAPLLAEHLRALGMVRSVTVENDGALFIHCIDADALYARICPLLAELGIPLLHFAPIRSALEERLMEVMRDA